MSIFQKLKKVWASDEAKELRTEVADTAKEFAQDAKVVAKKGAEMGKDVAVDVAGKAKEKIKEFKGDEISFDHFQKVDLRVGTIEDVEKVEKSEKLYKLTVSFGEESPRTVVSGIAKHYTMKALKGRQALFVTNMEPRSIMGIESQAMIIALSDDKNFALLSPEKEIVAGTKAS